MREITAPQVWRGERLDAPLCVLEGTKPNVKQKTSVGEWLKQLVSDDANALIAYRTLANLYQTDKEKYAVQKTVCSSILVGDFDYRKEGNCKTYLPLLVLDIDNYPDQAAMLHDWKRVQSSDFVYAAFPSVSGCGLRIWVWTNAEPHTHKTVYQQLRQYFTAFLQLSENKSEGNAYLDSSTSDSTRCWFYTVLPSEMLYVKHDAFVFQYREADFTLPKSTVLQQTTALSKNDKIQMCADLSATHSVNGRNNTVFHLACFMFENGINQDAVLQHVLQYEAADFSASEIQKTVNSAIKRCSFGKYNDAQLLSLLRQKIPQHHFVKQKILPESSVKQSVKHAQIDTKISKIIAFLHENYDLRYNILSNALEVSVKHENRFGQANENDLLLELYQSGFTGSEKMLLTYLASNQIQRFDPIRAYCKTLPKWDDTQPDYIRLLASFVQVDDAAWFYAQFKKMLVRVLACGLDKIPFNKQCFTLVGSQNDGKTTFLRFLCPPPLKPYYKENVSFDKDGRLVLCQNLFVNLEELDALNNREVKEIKTMLSTESVKDRLPYTKTPQTMRRCASFFASTNKTTFLSDETGNVRWLIFKIKGIKHDGGGANGYVKQVNIDLVWAQAFALLNNGFEFQLTADDLARSEQNNANFCQTYSELELIQELFTPSSVDEVDAQFLSATNIKECLEAAVATRKLSATQIGKALTTLGFVREQHYCAIKKFTKYGYWVKENAILLPFE